MTAALATMAALLSPLAIQGTAQAQPASCGSGDPAVVAGDCSVTIDARDFATGNTLANFNYIINLDNSKLPNDPLALNSESFTPIVRTGGQDRPTVTLPDGRYLVSARSLDHKLWGAYFTLPDDATNDALTVRVDLTEQSADHPLPLGRIITYVFEDRTWTNGAPDAEEAVENGAQGMQGFRVELTEETGNDVTVDYFNHPLCGGVCLTDSDGFNTIDNLGPAGYNIDVHPPDHCNPDLNAPNRLTTGPGQWYQTTTIDGGLSLVAPVEEGSDGTGAPGEQLWEPLTAERTGYFFGFVCAPMDFATPGTGEIVGRARNWVEWAPYSFGTFTDPVDFPFVAVTDSSTDATVAVTRGDADGNFDIQNVPAGSYIISVWDEQLNYIMRFKNITVAAGQTVDVNETGDDGSVGVGVSRWFGWLDGYVYKDTNGNGQMDPGEPTIGNTDVDQRWRDGSIKEGTFTDPDGYYVYPTAEGGALGRWIVGEQGFARFSSYPGASVHDEHTGAVMPSCVVEPPNAPADPCIPNSEGGGLLVNQLLLEGHRATVDWGKRDYPPGTPGQIVGITYFATTRNEFDARFQAHEDYEAAIPNARVYLETPGPDGVPNTVDDVIVNSYDTDAWVQPSASEDVPPDPNNSFRQNCNPIRDFNGADITSQLNPKIGPNCLEVPLNGIQTKEGKFDGGYAFADYCPTGLDEGAPNPDYPCNANPDAVTDPADPTHSATMPLVAGDYIVHAIMPKDPTDDRDCNPTNPDGFKNVSDPIGAIPGGGKGCLYHIVREEDVNVDLGNQFAPQIPPPPCVGDVHVIDQSTLVTRSNFFTGDQATSPSMPLCDKHLVVLENGQNANADFFMMTNFRTDPNGEDTSDTRVGDVAEPGRFVGQVFNDIYFETNPESPWYGEPRPIGGIPVGIYARVDTVCPDGGTNCATPNVNPPYDPNKWRLLTTVNTSADGSFEALVPSTETFNCPIPQGPCPGMYLITVDDPGTKDHPNANYDPNLLTATTPASAWPGLTNEFLDLPLDPISGTGCDFSVGPDGTATTVPELLQATRVASLSVGGVPVVGPVIQAGDAGTARQLTIRADFISAGAGTVRLTDDRTGAVNNLTSGNGGVVSWTPGSGSTPDTIVISVPALGTTTTGPAFLPGPKQLTIVNSNAGGGLSSVNGITVHVLGSNSGVTYTPTIVGVPEPPPAGTNPHALQEAIDGAADGNLLMLSPGTYNENVLVWKPLRIQGVGPGGIIGAHELGQRAPEDPRFKVEGSVVDGRFYPDNATYYQNKVTSVGAISPPGFAVDPDFSTILQGADLTVVAKTVSAYDVPSLTGAQDSPAFNGARIDGLGLQTGRGITGIGDVGGAGGIQLQAKINNIQITNNILENNSGGFAGGIGLGQPYAHGNHNYNVRIASDRVIGNGGLSRSGGLGIFYGSDNYEVARSIFCSNFGVEYGAGISHWGWSPRGSIHDNQVYYNDAVDSGAGIAIQNEIPGPTDPRSIDPNFLGDGTGSVNVDRNVIAANYSGDDGGGIFIQDALAAPINIRNNMIFDNGAADIGGAITLDDAANVRIVNDTIAQNVSTDSSEGSTPGVPHAAGLASEANDPRVAAVLATRTDTVTKTQGSPVVADPSIQASDLGKSVNGNGIGGNTTTIIAVNPGVGFTMSSTATNSGSASWTIYTLGVSANGTTPDFSNPRGLFNNIFWQNEGFTLDQFGPGATLTSAGFIDFEIHGTTNNADTFTPRYSDLTNGQILGPDGVLRSVPGTEFTPPLGQYLGSQANFIVDPAFVSPFVLELTVGGSRGDPQTAAVTITGADPPFGLNGDYLIQTTSPVVDRGAGFSNLAAPAPNGQTPTGSPTLVSILAPCSGTAAQNYPADVQRDLRPQLRTTRGRTPWDVGADELPKTPTTPVIVIPGSVNLPGNANDASFNWNGADQLQCSDSTETR